MKNKMIILTLVALMLSGLLPFTQAEASDDAYRSRAIPAQEALILNVSGKPRVALFFGIGHPLFFTRRYYYRRPYCTYGGYYRYYGGRRYFSCYRYPRRYYHYPRYYRDYGY